MNKNSRLKIQEVKNGNLKIFNFLKPRPSTSNSECNKDCSSIKPISLDSVDEDDFEVSEQVIQTVVNKENIKQSIDCTDSAILKKRKISEIDSNGSPPQKKYNVVIEREMAPDLTPSISENEKGKVTPPSTVNKQVIFVRSPEHLLSPSALKELQSPPKQSEQFLNKVKSTTPKKLRFDNKSTGSSFLSQVHEMSVIASQNAKMTPKKTNSNSKSEISPKEKRNITPSKSRKATKLFNKSPTNLNEFNVEIINKFIKITPSKCNIKKEDDDVIFVKSSEKKQSSILNYVSPSASKGSLEAQLFNESTPTNGIKDNIFRTPTANVKTQLDFNDCNRPTLSKKMPTPNSKTPVTNIFPTEETINFCSDFTFDDWVEEMTETPKEYTLDLRESRHCKIIKINPFPTKSILILESTKTGDQAKCRLEGFWVHSKLHVGDIIHVKARRFDDYEWIVNDESGLLVYEPDLLISTTSVVGSLWCKRKSVLTERLRSFESTNKAMLVGTLVHSMLQTSLHKKYRNRNDIENIMKILMKEQSTIRKLYECDITSQILEEELTKFIPKIEEFINLYVNNTNPSLKKSFKKDDWIGTINSIDDIEENFWSPELGLKGKIDVTIKTESHIMPLELKTGRATVSLEHRGQVMMYIMMMNKLGYNVPSGLLLYLREGVLREISITDKEKRDIMMLRNELAYYLTRQPNLLDDKSSEDRKLFPPELPEAINHPACEKCPYNVICTSYAKYTNEDISSKKTLSNIQSNVLSQLSESHLNYFMKWLSLIVLESNANQGCKQLREIYTVDPKQREINGKCIINLKVTSVSDECNGVFEHTFEKAEVEEGVNFYANGIMESNYIVISTDKRPAIASGFITNITSTSVSANLDRNLNMKYTNKLFHIDSYESNSVQSYNLASLSLLLEISPKSNELRKIIIDKAPPTFRTTIPKVIGTKGKDILRRLNKVQQRVVLRAIAAKDYFLIQGMPGTGKTSTIVALIQLLYELNKSILITSHTHSAVDNVCIKLLKYGIKLLRLGLESKVHPELKKYCEYNLTKDCTTTEQLEAVYNNAQIIAVTCLGSGHPVLSKRTLDVCIVDESTQVLQTSVIRPLYAANTFILIGDPEQLPAVVRSQEAREMGMSESLFERLYTKESAAALNLNYRMNSTITALANKVTYNGNLLIGNDTVANATMKLNKQRLEANYANDEWILNALDDSLEKAVQFLDTGPVWNLQDDVSWLIWRSNSEETNQNDSLNCVNIYEAAITATLVRTLLELGVDCSQIGVISTYRNQVAQISALLKCNNVDVCTVDQFQGKDKSIIIYSCTKSRDTSVSRVINKHELLEDQRRITVAITRAKHKLIIIGDLETVKEYSTFKKLVPPIGENIIRLPQSRKFQWKSVLDLFSH